MLENKQRYNTVLEQQREVWNPDFIQQSIESNEAFECGSNCSYEFWSPKRAIRDPTTDFYERIAYKQAEMLQKRQKTANIDVKPIAGMKKYGEDGIKFT